MADIKELTQALADRAEQVASMLLPGGRLIAREWCAGSIGGGEGKSLKVCCSGSKAGIWADFATGEAGDLLDLWRLCHGLSLVDAIKEVKSYLGIVDPVFTPAGQKAYRKPEPPKGAKLATSATSAVTRYLVEERKLAPETIVAYRIGEVAEVMGKEGPWIVFGSYHKAELSAIKYLHLNRDDKGKKVTMVEANCMKTCFGWNVIDKNAREVVVCEGELDAATLHQYGWPAVSVPFGAGGGNKQAWVETDWEEMERFETIYLCMDNDTEGSAATEELLRRLGEVRCKIVTLPYKDANECLQKGVTKAEIDKAFADAHTPDLDVLKPANAWTQDVLDEFYPSGGILPGFDMPWKSTGFRFLRGELTLVTGWNGHGKSQSWGQVMLSAMAVGEKVVIASLEMAPKKTLYRLVRQACAERRPSHSRVSDCLNWMSGGLWLFDVVGTSKVDEVLKAFDFAFRKYGCRQFVVDSLTKLGLAEDDYKGQKACVEKLCDFATKTGAHIHLVAHSRKGANELAPPCKLDIKGTGAITDLAFNCWIIHRNKQKEMAMKAWEETGSVPLALLKELGCENQEQLMGVPDVFAICDKSRNVERSEGKYGLRFDQESLQLYRKGECPVPYFDGFVTPDEVPPL